MQISSKFIITLKLGQSHCLLIPVSIESILIHIVLVLTQTVSDVDIGKDETAVFQGEMAEVLCKQVRFEIVCGKNFKVI